jgi:hypothetical protein
VQLSWENLEAIRDLVADVRCLMDLLDSEQRKGPLSEAMVKRIAGLKR